MDALPTEYRHEPELAFAGGVDGMDAVRAILREAPRISSPTGRSSWRSAKPRRREAAFPRLPFMWLETEGADDGVFALRREEIVAGVRG